MKKITLAKPAKENTSSVVLYAYTREGGSGCGCGISGNYVCPGHDCPDANGICR